MSAYCCNGGTLVLMTTLRGNHEELAAEFQRLVDSYVEARYARKA